MALPILNFLDPRIPKWDLDNLTFRKCPFCDVENSSQLVRPDKLTVAFCKVCGCWYVNRLPPISSILELYNNYYRTHRPSDFSELGAIRMLQNARKKSDRNWELQLLLRLHQGNKRIRILEVGCGSGKFLLQAKAAGADVVGCDLSPEACEFAERRLGIKVYLSELQSCSSPIGSVDVVVMRDFIEHAINPLADIRAAVEILKPGGILLVHTPNAGEEETDGEKAKAWVGFRVDLEHLQYLSSRTMNWVQNKFDMGIERLEASGFPRIVKFGSASRRKSKMTLLSRAQTRIYGLLGIVNGLRALKNGIKFGNQDPRLGSYHLLAIFRKR